MEPNFEKPNPLNNTINATLHGNKNEIEASPAKEKRSESLSDSFAKLSERIIDQINQNPEA